MILKRLLATGCLALVTLAGHSNAATIAAYTLTGGSTASSGLLGSSIGFEAGITASSTASDDLRITGAQTAGGAVGGSVYEDPDANRIATENWVTFSITVPDTQVIDLTSLHFDYTQVNRARFLLGVYTSKTGFVEGDHLLGLFDPDQQSTTSTDYVNSSVALSLTPSLQGLTNETVELRFLLGDDSGSPSRIHVLDNIVLNGTITIIPEPASIAMGAVGLSLLMVRRHRGYRRT